MPSTSASEQNRAITAWVEAYTDILYSWAFYKTSSTTTSEDLVQETFLAAVNAFDQFQQKSSPKTWLFSILNNKIKDHYRKKDKAPLSLERITEEHAYEITDNLFDINGMWQPTQKQSIWEDEMHILDNLEFKNVMANCMDDLPHKWRTAIDSKFLLEKNAQEICQELAISVSNYWQVIHRAKLLLKHCIDSHWKP